MIALSLSVTACANGQTITTRPQITLDSGETVQVDAVCDGLRKSLAGLARVAADEGTDAVVDAVALVLAKYDAGCPANS